MQGTYVIKLSGSAKLIFDFDNKYCVGNSFGVNYKKTFFSEACPAEIKGDTLHMKKFTGIVGCKIESDLGEAKAIIDAYNEIANPNIKIHNEELKKAEERAYDESSCANMKIRYEELKEFEEKAYNVQNGEVVYSVDGCRGRHIDVYEDKCIISTKVTAGSLLTGNVTDGEKTIYYADCIGVQFKESKLTVGYLQLETASAMMNNRSSNFFNENTFTFDGNNAQTPNEKMKIVADYVKKRVDEIKAGKNAPQVVQTQAVSAADEIKKFKELLDLGIITQEEFDAKKKQLLGL